LIEIIDQISNTIKRVPDSLEVVIDPKGNSFFLNDYQIEGKKLYSIIHKDDGTTIFLYKKPREIDEIKKAVEESEIFLAIIDEGFLNNIETLEQFLYAKFLKKPVVILEEDNALERFPKLTEGCDILLRVHLAKDEPPPKDLSKKIKDAWQQRKRG